MTLFFNIENLETEARSNSNRFMLLLETLYVNKLPKTQRGLNLYKLPLNGSSFILNPAPLFDKRYKHIDVNYKVQYVKLAGRRDYGFYKYHGITSLQLSYFPDIILENIKTNPLLDITKTEIKFLYEDQRK